MCLIFRLSSKILKTVKPFATQFSGKFSTCHLKEILLKYILSSPGICWYIYLPSYCFTLLYWIFESKEGRLIQLSLSIPSLIVSKTTVKGLQMNWYNGFYRPQTFKEKYLKFNPNGVLCHVLCCCFRKVILMIFKNNFLLYNSPIPFIIEILTDFWKLVWTFL